MKSREIFLALNLVPYIETSVKYTILEYINDIKDITKMSRTMLLSIPGVGESTAARILTFDYVSRLEKELSAAEKNNVKIVTILDEDYPESLRQIYSPPAVLYIRGSTHVFEVDRSVAVVGTRKPTPYGKQVTSKLVSELAAAGITIVSGLAYGIDSVAHAAAIESGGITLAVLGNGVDYIYPAKHKELYKKIMEKGALISEFPLGMKPVNSNFPIRNRIISGLTTGTLVIEAAEKSGSLITAKYALEQNKDVFAVPGNITSRSSIGTNYLIKKGAKLVQRADDILNELPFDFSSEESTDVENVKTKTDWAVDNFLTPLEKQILSTLEFDKPIHIDIVCSLLKEEPNRIWQKLVELELKNAVIQQEGKFFVRKFKGDF